MKTLFPLAIALALAGCGDSPEARLERAAKAFAAHDYRAAQIDLAAALQEQPDNQKLLELAARNYLAQGDGVAAQGALDKLRMRPADFALLAGEAALLRGQPKEALQALDGRKDSEAFRLRALVAVALDDPKGAETAFAAGASAPGAKARLFADHARFRLAQADLAGAAALSRQAIGADPRQLDALLVGAEVAVANGDLAAALKQYDRAAAAYPGNLAALAGKAGVLGDLGRKAELAELVDKVAKSAGGDPRVAYLQARVAADANDWRKVRDLLQPLESSLEGRDDAQVLYAQAQLALGQAELARSRLEPLVRRVPGNALAAMLLARAQLGSGDSKGAVATLEARAAKPDAPHELVALMAKATRAAGDASADAYAARAGRPSPQELGAELAKGDTALKAGNWQAAAVAYRRILSATDGRNALVLNNLAYAEQQLGNDRRAVELALKALKLAPDNPSVMDTAGWLLAKTGGDRNHALDLLREAARRAPANRTIASHLAEAEKG